MLLLENAIPISPAMINSLKLLVKWMRNIHAEEQTYFGDKIR
jgi:hypothetical protein